MSDYSGQRWTLAKNIIFLQASRLNFNLDALAIDFTCESFLLKMIDFFHKEWQIG